MFAMGDLGHQRPFKPKLTMRYLLEYCSLTIMELEKLSEQSYSIIDFVQKKCTVSQV